MAEAETACQVQVHISAEDRPGILAEILAVVAGKCWHVLDIKQFVFHGLLNLSLLLEKAEGGEVAPLSEALTDHGARAKVGVRVFPWEPGLRPEVPYRHRSVVTLLGSAIPTPVLLDFTETLAGQDINILRIEQLDHGDKHVIELLIGTREAHSSVDVLNALVRFKESFQVDIAVQDDTLFRRNKRLIVFDADMTFLQCEVIDELGKLAGVGPEMAVITHQAMNGELDFRLALKKRVGLLKGLSVNQLEELAGRIPITPGAENLVKILKHLGYKIAIVSGGFQFFIDKLTKKYGLDYGFANQLEITGGQISGRLTGRLIDASVKKDILMDLAKKEGFSLRQVVAVGDGANDIDMLAMAGLGIAFNAKPIVQRHARASINQTSLELILYFLGINGKDLQELREIVA
ncbi:MAG: phosphoserine phosphatase SerB [Nitrospinaceae bacterium]|nr:MAG: phosphoserine phosphatase SerB [Nitrospinaceae bacterium]